jgi:hypothetical protein
MEQQLVSLEQVEVVPKVVRVSVERSTGYGSVPGLEDEELADPAELERQVFLEEWGPILALPCRSAKGGIRPTIDEMGHLDWGAFGTVDFQRLRPAFDWAGREIDRLQEQLRCDLFMLEMVRERVRPEARGRVRELALHSWFDEFEDGNEWAYARWLRRVQHDARRIQGLRSRRRKQRHTQATGGRR